MTALSSFLQRLLVAGAAALIVATGAGAAAVPGPSDGHSLTAQFRAVGDSGVRGSVTLTERASVTRASLRVRGLRPGSVVRAQLYFGTCADPGRLAGGYPPVAELTANGAGVADATGRVRDLAA